MNQIGRFDCKSENALNSLASNPQCMETTKRSMAKTNHKLNKIGGLTLKVHNALNSLASSPQCIETRKRPWQR